MNAVENAYLAWASWHETDDAGDRLAQILEIKARPPIKRIMVAAWMPNSKLVSRHIDCDAIAQVQPFNNGWPNMPFACQSCGKEVAALRDITVRIQIWDGEVAA